ncbi:pre-B lymphocyte protein 3 [Gastrophryne carolinensis]
MTYITVLLALISACTYCAAQVTLTQPATESVTPGNTVTLPCILTGYSISDRYVYWYQQKDGNRPRYLLYYKDDSSKHQGDGVPDRFSGSKDTPKNTGYLTIKGVLSEDEGIGENPIVEMEISKRETFCIFPLDILEPWGLNIEIDVNCFINDN